MFTLAIDCTDEKLAIIINLLKTFLQILQIVVPIGLIVLGTLDFGKGVIASDEGAIKKNQKRFITRCLSAVLVFLVVAIVNFVMSYIGNNEWKNCWNADVTVKDKDLPAEGVNKDGYEGGTTDDGRTHSSGGGNF